MMDIFFITCAIITAYYHRTQWNLFHILQHRHQHIPVSIKSSSCYLSLQEVSSYNWEIILSTCLPFVQPNERHTTFLTHPKDDFRLGEDQTSRHTLRIQAHWPKNYQVRSVRIITDCILSHGKVYLMPKEEYLRNLSHSVYTVVSSSALNTSNSKE